MRGEQQRRWRAAHPDRAQLHNEQARARRRAKREARYLSERLDWAEETGEIPRDLRAWILAKPLTPWTTRRAP